MNIRGHRLFQQIIRGFIRKKSSEKKSSEKINAPPPISVERTEKLNGL